MKTAEFVLVT